MAAAAFVVCWGGNHAYKVAHQLPTGLALCPQKIIFGACLIWPTRVFLNGYLN